MGQLIPTPELSLDFKPTFIPKTITQFLGEISSIGSVSEKILKIDDFINRFEAEITKIDAFKRELPLCMLLMNDGNLINGCLFFCYLIAFWSWVFDYLMKFVELE